MIRELRELREMEGVGLLGRGFNAKSQGREDAMTSVDRGSFWPGGNCAAADGPGSGPVRMFFLPGFMLWKGVSHSEGFVNGKLRKNSGRGKKPRISGMRRIEGRQRRPGARRVLGFQGDGHRMFRPIHWMIRSWVTSGRRL